MNKQEEKCSVCNGRGWYMYYTEDSNGRTIKKAIECTCKKSSNWKYKCN